MNELFRKYSDLYNNKYKKNVKFVGSFRAYKQPNNEYYLCGNLIVKNSTNEIIYDFSKDFIINDKTISIFFNQYEIIDIYNDICNNNTLFNCE